jgi:arylsulfatase A-like enzyme
MMTGMSPDHTGCVGWVTNQRIAMPQRTLPSLLRQEGYQTAMVGRDIHQYPEDCRYGFDTMMSLDAEENNYYSKFVDFNREEYVGKDRLFANGLTFNGISVKPWQYDEKFHTTNFSVNKAVEFLDNRDSTCPFFMYVGFVAPHPPFLPPKYYLDYYLNRTLQKPAIGEWVETPYNSAIGSKINGSIQNGESEGMRIAQAGYYALIHHIDDQMQTLLSRIAREDNTYIIFTSDHGEMLGDHHRFRKSLPYEGAVKIPFILSGPTISQRCVVDKVIGLQDILPTICDIAGIDIPDNVTGRSILALIRDEEWRDYIHGEHAPMHECDGSEGECMIHNGFHYLTDGRMKYVWFNDGYEQLFNLLEDPKELKELSKDPQYQEELEKWRNRLIQELVGRPEGFSDGITLYPNREYKHYLPHAVIDN